MIINFPLCNNFDLNLKILAYVSIYGNLMIISSVYGGIQRVLKFCGKIISSLPRKFTLENQYLNLFLGRTF